ncbi:MAG: hypothetical protein H8E44_41370 [Planctomycetes bacterium]|nr:hypothetical protein [Planctomycetota bacterium]MBL7039125.1 hypothetical protein [Pirellulaceae bacterium]
MPREFSVGFGDLAVGAHALIILGSIALVGMGANWVVEAAAARWSLTIRNPLLPLGFEGVRGWEMPLMFDVNASVDTRREENGPEV